MNTSTQREQEEIEFLERLYCLPSEQEQIQMNGNDGLTQLAAEVIAEAELAAKRAGTNGAWCYGCGRPSIATASCDCPHPENFGCAGHKFCPDCVVARKRVAAYLKTLFAMKISARVNSTRSRAYRFVTEAADTDGLRRGQALRTCLFRFTDPHDDEPEEFMDNVMRAFRRSQFFDFSRLATGIEDAERDFLVWRVVRSGIVGRPPRVQLGAEPDEEFYR